MPEAQCHKPTYVVDDRRVRHTGTIHASNERGKGRNFIEAGGGDDAGKRAIVGCCQRSVSHYILCAGDWRSRMFTIGD